MVARGEAPDFNRDIRPILSENCFHCHGPDARAREANLRLDTFLGATTGGEFDDPIVPGKPGESEVITRIHSDDSKEVMPPPDSKRSLTPKQKTLLRDWIASGAKYETHWAWITPQRPATPVTRNKSLIANPIDAFLLRRLESENLNFSEPADATTLLRRLSLDLIGLPPSLKELNQFKLALRNPGGEEQAYRDAVDRLLASPRFGERWARPWLDLARYADSNGFQADQLRPSWAYRDWVIDALNANMPYDQFTIEQLSGDLLPAATIPQKVATGFHRTVTCNVEAGVHPEENRYNQVIDRVNTTGTTWLGITMECAQCHDHKFDPFTMKDYYSLFAFFNNTPLEVSAPSGKNDVSHDFIGPYLDLPLSPEDQKRADTLDEELATLRKKKKTLLAHPASGFAAWEAEAITAVKDAPQWQTLNIISFNTSGGENHRILDDGSILITGKVPDTTRYTIEARTDLANLTSFKLEALTHPDIPGKGPGRGDKVRSNFVLNELKAVARTPQGETPLDFTAAAADFSQKDWPAAGLVDGKPKTGWAIAPQFGKPHWATVKLADPLKNSAKTTFIFTLEQNFGKGRSIGCFRLSAISNPNGLSTLPDALASILRKPAAERSKAETAKLTTHYTNNNPEVVALDTEIARLTKQRETIKPVQTLVMVEMDQARKSFITSRGNYLAPEAEVHPATPEILPASRSSPKNRLDLARWIVRRDNPLTARVAVNRWWAEIFGNGIVGTLEDFGTQSDPPSHPDLLDWLAVEFMDSGWDMKHLLKTIVLSKAYRQSSRLTPALREKDPRNILLARAPRFRLNAERVRDNALTVSGLLSTRMHGPPVMPFQPPGVWRQVGRNEPKWKESKDEDRWRRGVYVVYRRAAPYPSMVNFDAPDRAACTVNRPRTNTPLQALTLLNDPAYVEMALALSDRILVESPTPKERLTTAFLLTLSRAPNPQEQSIINDLLNERLAHFKANPEAVDKLLRNSTFVYRPRHQNQVELATWFYLASTLLNLDETMTKP
jgi:hypothetical protein